MRLILAIWRYLKFIAAICFAWIHAIHDASMRASYVIYWFRIHLCAVGLRVFLRKSQQNLLSLHKVVGNFHNTDGLRHDAKYAFAMLQ